MWKTVLRRVLIMIPEVIVLSVLVFLLAKAMPGDPFTGSIGPHTSAAQIHQLKVQAGLYNPWYQQYWNWVVHLFHGNLGTSFQYQEPVTRIIGERAINTVWLALFTMVLTYAIAIPMGLYAGRHQNHIGDNIIRVYTFVTMAIPPFVILLIALWIFGYVLGWAPTTGSVSATASGTMGTVLSRLQHIILPGLVASLTGTVNIVQYLRSEVIDAKHSDYVRTARSKGVPTTNVFRHHILRNSLLPIAAFAGYSITGLLGGSVVTEMIFSYPGMGLLFLNSISYRDYTVITALVLLYGLLNLLGTLLSDIILTAVDPRVRVQ
ncbi:MAG: ABC transporter permease [Furfurilactobacillus sp.]|jgi:peptide/nickel transport system permease protein|uniref:ABC transporter permease n=1 Tax=Furfurilactobacillus milii TaxID=2888272 RepID=A0ABT6D8Z9_9LACO|nr:MULTISPECIES: ABC transporter permease [Furfurilactobacillus]QLE67228.1 ABC-type oligopeptide transport system permease protein [Furfurilactobacillus rossiae]MCF6161080.1 ABC transporter permease [Furfurilactobacillus milii]MCF6163430.1 ABC transporter permease [Furfurilactobacillus milii]MCF6418768.1 ABC transporter permease [Furfurilactobacillus milii]MCH4011420.1 ABC transporter permease [Furfurilactobacillus sp.]